MPHAIVGVCFRSAVWRAVGQAKTPDRDAQSDPLEKLRILKRVLSEVPNSEKTWRLRDQALSIKPKERNRVAPDYGV